MYFDFSNLKLKKFIYFVSNLKKSQTYGNYRNFSKYKIKFLNKKSHSVFYFYKVNEREV